MPRRSGMDAVDRARRSFAAACGGDACSRMDGTDYF